jgi:hypothetical protein
MLSTRHSPLASTSLCFAACVFAIFTTTATPSHAGTASSSVISLDGNDWLLATDAKNVGRTEQWFRSPRPEAKKAKVPFVIQDTFPGYGGLAWYWREFAAPVNEQPEGRYLLRFWAVHYKADVWVNDALVGGHEGGEDPFVFDVTQVIKPGQANRLAVRVLNPTHERIDGIKLGEFPNRNRAFPPQAGASWNIGGIVDSVELLVTPAVRVEDVFLQPDWKTGAIRIQTTYRNATDRAVKASLEYAVAPAAEGKTVARLRMDSELPPGETIVESELTVPGHRLWGLNDPILYRVTVQVAVAAPHGLDEHSVRCGFRDFRFERGVFRLNGKRIYPRCSHTGNGSPTGLEIVTPDPDYFRRDLLNAKVMRLNMIRFFGGVPQRYQLDQCDEIGLLVFEESYATIPVDAPERVDRSNIGMIRRDRNHPSVVIWSLLNETENKPPFRHAVEFLPTLRKYDNTRVVLLNSGRFDYDGNIGSLSNPGSAVWEKVMGDAHIYPRAPMTADAIRGVRTHSGNGVRYKDYVRLYHEDLPTFFTEGGIGSALDYTRMMRLFEQIGRPSSQDAGIIHYWNDRHLAEYERLGMSDIFPRPSDFFRASLVRGSDERTRFINAVRANPKVIGYSMTGMVEETTGEGIWTNFREFKPGTPDALFEGLAPLRWCNFVEPVNVYRKTPVRLEAVLANEDAMLPGKYPVHLLVVGPKANRSFEKRIEVTIPEKTPTFEPPMVMPVFDETVVIDGPSGKYRFLVEFERGGAATGGDTEFYVADPAELPAVDAEIVLWGEDPQVAEWLSKSAIKYRPFDAKTLTSREAILALNPPKENTATAFVELANHMARGSTAVFLSPGTLAREKAPTGWIPLVKKGNYAITDNHVYHKDEWCKGHPIFDGLPSRCLMDYTFYRELIPDGVFFCDEVPHEVVAGATNASYWYSSGVLVGVYRFNEGRFLVNSLLVRENLGKHPAADRLLRNMLRWAAAETAKPLAPFPANFDEQLKAMGY